MVIGPITFLAPLALLGLLALPIIWWILRITPPKPIDQVFPPLRLLMDVNKEEETPNSTPLWLLLFRLFLGALIAIALANPILFKTKDATNLPVLLIIDNGWAAAGNWAAITTEAETIVKQAIAENQNIAVVTSIETGQRAGFTPAPTALTTIRSLTPLPDTPRRDQLAQYITTLDISKARVVWLSDGIDYTHVEALQTVLKASPEQNIYLPNTENSPLIAGEITETANGFRSVWHRLDPNGLRGQSIAAYGANGQIIARAPLSFTPGNTASEAQFDLPAELRNQVSQLRVQGFASAGAVTLLDDTWGRPLIGLLKGSDENTQPLLSEWHFIEQALSPNADIYKGDLDQLIAVAPAIIFMTDRARTESEALISYVEKGGLLVRFAGPKLAKRSDALLPIDLRSGGRELGGALAWEDPQGFAPFNEDSPFFGLSTHEEITVHRQIMARPGAETDSRTWARLMDGSPVITSAPHGLGRIVFFHVTAGPDWSGLPLSGLYVQMLKRILPLARATNAQVKSTQAGGDWSPERTLNGFGQLGMPPLTTRPIAHDGFANTKVSSSHPPGLYRQGVRRQALNTISNPEDYKMLTTNGFNRAVYGGKTPKSLAGLLLGLAALLLALDVILSLIASGRLRLPTRQKVSALGLVIGLLCLVPVDGSAQETRTADTHALHLAYVLSGESAIDSMSRAGLEGLRFELNRRTTIEPEGVRAVNIETDPIDFYPFLYWPVTRGAKPLSDTASRKVNAYMASGGTLVFDTQDYDRQTLLGAQTHPGLEAISKSLDIPRLAPPPKDHVITKSFFLIQVFPGRWAGGKIWLEADQRGSARDGVSSVVVGSNDWSAAWAKDDRGRTLAVIENDIPRQREFAYRFGVNLTMYALAGNYKADQVHAATLIERLGDNNLDKPGIDQDEKEEE